MKAGRTILRTLAFADAFDMPLTAFEAWRFLLQETNQQPTTNNQRPSFLETLKNLDQLREKGKVSERWGFYVLIGREELIEDRLHRLAVCSVKLRTAEQWARRIVRLPYVRGVFASGTLATGQTKDESDLDVLIVTAPDRIFTARIFVTLLTEMFGVRRTQTKIRDRICLNHYITEDALTFPYQSAFSAWLYVRIFPLALRDVGLASRFFAANTWAKEWFPNADFDTAAERKKTEKKSRNGFADLFERLLKTFQIRRIARHPFTRKPGARIVASDTMLVFHPELPGIEQQTLMRYHTTVGALIDT